MTKPPLHHPVLTQNSVRIQKSTMSDHKSITTNPSQHLITHITISEYNYSINGKPLPLTSCQNVTQILKQYFPHPGCEHLSVKNHSKIHDR